MKGDKLKSRRGLLVALLLLSLCLLACPDVNTTNTTFTDKQGVTVPAKSYTTDDGDTIKTQAVITEER